MNMYEKYPIYQIVYDRLAEELEGWADLTEEQRYILVDSELIKGIDPNR